MAALVGSDDAVAAAEKRSDQRVPMGGGRESVKGENRGPVAAPVKVAELEAGDCCPGFGGVRVI